MPIAVLLTGILTWVLAKTIVRVILALAISFYTYKGLDDFIQRLMNTMVQYFSDFPQTFLMLMRLAEVDTALTIIFSAMLTKVALNAGMIVLGIRR